MYYSKYEYCGYCRYCICDDVRMDIMGGKFRCDRQREWVFADARPLKDNCFWQVASYNLSDRDGAIKASKSYRNFYITTAIYDYLNLSTSNELDQLYEFRHNYLDKEGISFTKEYDIFAPRIAKYIELTKNDGLIKNIYEFYIKGTIKYINSGLLDDAYALYKSMYDMLKRELVYGYVKSKEMKHVKNL